MVNHQWASPNRNPLWAKARNLHERIETAGASQWLGGWLGPGPELKSHFDIRVMIGGEIKNSDFVIRAGARENILFQISIFDLAGPQKILTTFRGSRARAEEFT